MAVLVQVVNVSFTLLNDIIWLKKKKKEKMNKKCSDLQI